MDSLAGLDFFDGEPIRCCVKNCTNEAQFIAKYPPHRHFENRWYPVCLRHAKVSGSTPCRMCAGKLFTREAIETL